MNRTPPPMEEVTAWRFQDVLLETYRYPPGKATTSPTHVHEDYQICLSLDFPGTYSYRGAVHRVPIRSISILHPGEKHACYDPHDREIWSHYAMFYVPAHRFQAVGEYARKPKSPQPFFRDLVYLSDDLFDVFAHLHTLLRSPAPLLEQEQGLYLLLDKLTHRYAVRPGTLASPRAEGSIVRQVQEYLQAHYQANPSLTDLATLVGRHPVYVHQTFQKTVGVTPHAYLTQIRVERAKRLLASGVPIVEVARSVGFYDQSHLGKYFRRYTGVTPARYRALKTSYT